MLTVYVVGVLLTFVFQFVLARRSEELQRYDPEVLGVALIFTSLFWPATVFWHLFRAVFTAVGRLAQKKVEPGAKSKSNVVY